jgi:Tfp pilus assembly protein FimT
MQVESYILVERPDRMTRRGVTLIETILVITLLAAASLGGLILFDGQWTARRSVSQVTTDVAGALTTARNTSINSQAMVRVTRGAKNGRQQLVITEDTGPFRAGSTREIDLGDEARVSGRPRTIQFHSDGTANRNVTWKVAQQGVSGTVTVSPVSGQVSQTLP